MTTIFRRIKTALVGDSASKGSTNAVIDAASLFEAQHGSGRPRLPEQVQLLNKLADFSSKEGVNVTAVFDSRALRESPNGEVYKDVLTYYTNQEKPVLEMIKHGVSKRGGNCIVITSNPEVEAAMKADGKTVISAVTFKKALDAAMGKSKSSGGSSQGNRRGGGGRRQGGRRQNSSQKRSGSDENRSRPKQNQKPRNPEKDPIFDLIDPL